MAICKWSSVQLVPLLTVLNSLKCKNERNPSYKIVLTLLANFRVFNSDYTVNKGSYLFLHTLFAVCNLSDIALAPNSVSCQKE